MTMKDDWQARQAYEVTGFDREHAANVSDSPVPVTPGEFMIALALNRIAVGIRRLAIEMGDDS